MEEAEANGIKDQTRPDEEGKVLSKAGFASQSSLITT